VPITLAIIGAVLLVAGLVLDVHLLWIAGVVALLVALVLLLLGHTGHLTSGRRRGRGRGGL
jgi:hypothetical protein